MKPRLPWLGITLLIIAAGLGSRRFPSVLPTCLSPYAGDILWAAMVFCGIRILKPSLSLGKNALLAVGFSYAIEVSQLYRSPWIDSLRSHRLAALVLGQGFLWSDLLCYAVGVGAALGGTWVTQRIRTDP